MPERKLPPGFAKMKRRPVFIGYEPTPQQLQEQIIKGRCYRAPWMARHRGISPLEMLNLLPLMGLQMSEFLRQMDKLRHSNDLRDAFVCHQIKEAYDTWRDAAKHGQNLPA